MLSMAMHLPIGRGKELYLKPVAILRQAFLIPFKG
jgi:hypothetical protein